MGRPQYSDPNAEGVAVIVQAVDDIETIVTEIQDTDLANLEENIFSPLKYDPFTYGYNGSSFVAGQWFEVLNIQGEGYFETILGMMNGNGSMGIEITVDGIKIWDTYILANTVIYELSGITQAKNVSSFRQRNDTDYLTRFVVPIQNTTNLALEEEAFINRLYMGVLPCTIATGNPPVMLAPDKIEFKTSLVVRFKNSITSGVVFGEFIGGIKK